jgi:hypothetical protein
MSYICLETGSNVVVGSKLEDFFFLCNDYLTLLNTPLKCEYISMNCGHL